MPKPKLLQFPDRTDGVADVLLEALAYTSKEGDAKEVLIFMTTKDSNLMFSWYAGMAVAATNIVYLWFLVRYHKK